MPVIQKSASQQPVISLPIVNLKRLRVEISSGRCQIPASQLSSPSSSEEDEAVEAKRRRLDPDYQPSSASDSSTTTAGNSQEEDETDTETEEESWCPSRSTSPEIISSSEDN
jgi:hypothetical protein